MLTLNFILNVVGVPHLFFIFLLYHIDFVLLISKNLLCLIFTPFSCLKLLDSLLACVFCFGGPCVSIFGLLLKVVAFMLPFSQHCLNLTPDAAFFIFYLVSDLLELL